MNDSGIQRLPVGRETGSGGAYDRPMQPPITSPTPMYCQEESCSCSNRRANRTVSAGYAALSVPTIPIGP